MSFVMFRMSCAAMLIIQSSQQSSPLEIGIEQEVSITKDPLTVRTSARLGYVYSILVADPLVTVRARILDSSLRHFFSSLVLLPPQVSISVQFPTSLNICLFTPHVSLPHAPPPRSTSFHPTSTMTPSTSYDPMVVFLLGQPVCYFRHSVVQSSSRSGV